jgi:outer membrane protein OmpA-like peptidoglycan-associated protein
MVRSPLPGRVASLLAAALGIAPLALAGQGMTLRVAPDATVVRWGETVGLENAALLGGGLSLGFGRYVTLRGSYGTAGVLDTRFAGVGLLADDGSTLDENEVNTSLFSAGVLFRLGNRRVAPILSTRGGILRLAPDSREEARQIVFGYGGGLDVRLARVLDGQILLERSGLRLDHALLARPDAAPFTDATAGATQHSLTLGASLGMRLGAGGSRRADRVDQDFDRLLGGSAEGLLVPLEAHVGVVRFDDALGLEDQPTVALRTGLDLGPYFGVRARIYQGVTDGFDDFRGIWGWSGELQFNVGKVTGASPHLLLGAGQTRINDEYRAETGSTLDDQNELVLGVGLGIPVDDRTRVTFALRDHVTASGALDRASSTSDLRHSFALSGGVSVLLAGRREADREPLADAAAPDSADYRSGRLLAIPVPKEGEVYVRYGPGARTLPTGAGPDSAAVGAAVQEELIRLVGAGQVTLSDSARAALQARVLQRLQAITTPAAPDTGAAARAPTPGAVPGTPGAEASVEELRLQVQELTRLVRESLVLQGVTTLAGAGGTTVNVVTGAPDAGIGAGPSEPFFRALDGRLGRSAMGDGGGGIALHLDAHLGRLRDNDNLIPFASLELARQGIRTDAGTRSAKGSASTLGLGFGVTAVLPHVGPVWPTVDVLVAAARAGTSADRPADEGLIDDRFGGLSLGPGFQLGAAYRPDPARRVFVTAALRKLWAGSTSRWTAQAGLRWVFPPRSGTTSGPFSVGRSQAAAEPDTLPAAQPPPAVDTTAALGPAPADTAVATLAARVEALEARLRQEAEARQRAEAEAAIQRLRADSLAAARSAPAPEGAAVAARPAQAEPSDVLLRELRAQAARSTFVTSVEELEGSIRIVLGGLLFPVGATDVAGSSSADVRSLGAILATRPGVAVSVEGHTDDTGTEEANLTISRLRAEAVRRLLVEGGLEASTLSASGRGEASPAADNGTREGRARNRRVEILVRLAPEVR